jgi:hypothetical protein
LEGIIERVRKRRQRIIKRRKRKGLKKLPRKTLFKPVQKPNLLNNPLWNEVFLNEENSNLDLSLIQPYEEPDKWTKRESDVLKKKEFKLPPVIRPLLKSEGSHVRKPNNNTSQQESPLKGNQSMYEEPKRTLLKTAKQNA